MKLNIFTFGSSIAKMKYLKKSEEMFGTKINYIILSNPMSSIDDKRISQESCGIQRENDLKSFYSSDSKGY